jgi:thymidine kinase
VVTLLLGPMMSGKSSELLRRATRETFAKKRPIVIKPSVDSRPYFTHSKIDHSIEVSFSDLTDEFNDYDGLYVDEAQFFDVTSLVSFVHRTALTHNVTLAGLNGDTDMKPWASIQALIPIVDKIETFSGVCVKCGSELGCFTGFRGGHKDKVLVGGSEDSYVCLCRECWNEERKCT